MAKKPAKKATKKPAKAKAKSRTTAHARTNGNGAVKRTATGLAALSRAPAESKKYILGSSKIFTPEVMNDIHIKSELGRYRMRGFSLFKKIPHSNDLNLLTYTLTRFVIEGYREKCDTQTIIGPRAKRPMVLDIP